MTVKTQIGQKKRRTIKLLCVGPGLVIKAYLNKRMKTVSKIPSKFDDEAIFSQELG